jgi:diadenosine tetraphosphatase ApaH/serine/threonine PP2A family protein phosphatase
MKLALLADIHANLEALDACLAHARAQGAQRYAFLGDLVGYGADPGAVLDVIARHADAGAVVVLGNHDAAVLGQRVDPLNEYAQAAVDWTRERLSAPQREFLEALPLSVRDGNVLFVHASAAVPRRFTYVTNAAQAHESMAAAKAAYVFCGHVHTPRLYYVGAAGRPLPFEPEPGTPIPMAHHRRWLAIVGSAGQPRDRDPDACYALADFERERMTFFRVPYDNAAAAAKVRAAGLPERLALRLEHGD